MFLEMYVVEPSLIDIIVNAGQDEGLVAWARLVHRFEPKVKTQLAGMLVDVLNWSFTGDLASRMEAFERKLAEWEKRAGERVSDQIRIGIVLRALPADTVREQLLINSGQYNTWVQFREG